jgi:hypothetical protein
MPFKGGNGAFRRRRNEAVTPAREAQEGAEMNSVLAGAVLGALFILAAVVMNHERNNHRMYCPPGSERYVFRPTSDMSLSELQLMPRLGFVCLDQRIGQLDEHHD